MNLYKRTVGLIAMASLLACNPPMDNADPIKSNLSSFSAEIFIYFEKTSGGDLRTSVIASLRNEKGKLVISDSTRFFVNKEYAQFSLSKHDGYYGEYPKYSWNSKETKMDTLHFSILLQDSSRYYLGSVEISKFIAFMKNENLIKTPVKIDKMKSLVLNWGGELPDQVVVSRQAARLKAKDSSVVEGTGDVLFDVPYDYSHPPIIKSESLLKTDSGNVYKLYIDWYKHAKVQLMNAYLKGTISIEAKIRKEVILDSNLNRKAEGSTEPL
jgi:hypothetical protein